MFAIFLFYGCDMDETYIVSFYANGGMGRMQSQLFDAGVPQALTQNLYTRDGYTFSGWNTMQAGNGAAYINGQTITVTSDMTLYAQWTGNGTSGGGQSGSGILNGHDYVDLGLPSGTLWATCNVGSTTPEGYGDYFAWGETSPKINYSWLTYCLCDGPNNELIKYCNNWNDGYNGFTDALSTLEASDDAATANWGLGWRMPTHEEMEELMYCNKTHSIYNGVNGWLITGPNGNSIFLPAAGYCQIDYHSDANIMGYYWSSSLRAGNPNNAWFIVFNMDVFQVSDSYRDYGLSVRPVCNRDGGQQGSGTGSGTQDEEPHTGGRGVLNGYNYVDLGLPSGTKWAFCNVGATTPGGYGDYFAWGETTLKETYGLDTYRWYNISDNTYTKYCHNASLDHNNGFTDHRTTLEASDDVATANWGAGWRMPTKAEMQELYDNCTQVRTTENGYYGLLFTGPNDNSIFLPFAGYYQGSERYGSVSDGYYWSSSLSTDDWLTINSTDRAWRFYFRSDNGYMSSGYRSDGLSVRAVCNQQCRWE